MIANRARADIIEIGPADNLPAAIAALEPGDELVLAGGVYNISAKLTIGVSGTAGLPIVIRAKEGETPIITRPDPNQNTINIENNAYVVLRGLEVTGGSHGIRINHASFITIEDCHIHDTGDVAISANVGGSAYQGLQLLRNHIHDTNNTGEGMYLGCNQNACQMFDSLIEGNYIHHTNGPTVAQGDGIEIKEGSYNNIVRDNVIHDTNYPCIITYSTVGNGAANTIERNVMWGCGDHGIQAAADVIIRNNIILSASANAIRNQPHQSGTPDNIVIAYNTILKPAGDAIRSDGVTGSVVVANNAIYAPNGSAIRATLNGGQVNAVGNIGVGSLQGVAGGFSASGDLAGDFVSATLSGATPNDVFPKVGSALIGSADGSVVVSEDFNGVSRSGSLDVGAYRYDANGNPGWALEPDFKDPTVEEPTGTGGGGMGGSENGAGGSTSSNASTTGSSSGGGGAGGSGGSGGADGGGSDDSGCDCNMNGNSQSGSRASLWLAGLGALGLIMRFASRRSARAPGARPI